MLKLENLVGTSWAIKGISDDSDCSFDAPKSGFNYDSKYLINVRGLPWSATKPEIADFFGSINILNGQDGIHFIIDERNMKQGQAFIQLDQLRDLTAALKINKKYMEDRYIEGMIRKMK